MMMMMMMYFVYSGRSEEWLSAEMSSEAVYRAACDQNNVAPQTAILRGLAQHQINVRHRCLGDRDAHALSTALCVRIDARA